MSKATPTSRHQTWWNQHTCTCMYGLGGEGRGRGGEGSGKCIVSVDSGGCLAHIPCVCVHACVCVCARAAGSVRGPHHHHCAVEDDWQGEEQGQEESLQVKVLMLGEGAAQEAAWVRTHSSHTVRYVWQRWLYIAIVVPHHSGSLTHIHAHAHTCMRTHSHTCMHTHTYTHTRTRICARIHTHTHTQTHTHTHTHTHDVTACESHLTLEITISKTRSALNKSTIRPRASH